MHWVYLSIAIGAEVIATTFLKMADGFSKPLPSIAVVVGYAVSFYFLSLTLRTLPIGIAYAVWCGVGIVFITFLGWIFYQQKLDLPAIIGIVFIGIGVVIINFFSKSSG